MKLIGYLVNQYPAPSQTFIRREIAAIESQGVAVTRYAIRNWGGDLVDAADRAEAERTRYILSVGLPRLVLALLASFVSRPGPTLNAFFACRRLARNSGRGLAVHLIYLAEAAVLRSWTSGEGIGHLHAHFGTNSAAVAMLCRLLGGPEYSFTVHGPEEFDDPVGLSLEEKVRHSRFAVAISSFGRSQLWRWCRLDDWPKIKIVHCGLGIEYLDREPTPPPLAPRFVHVGRLSEQKGQALLVEAAALLRDEGRDFEIIVIGDGDLRPMLERRIASLGLARNVRLTGWGSGETVLHAILDARALVLPSFAEGLPVVLMEALALGRPVVTTAIAGIPELVRPGESGWLVSAGDAEALAGAMAEVLSASVDRLSEMGEAGATRVRARHDAGTEGRKLLDHIRAFEAAHAEP